MELDSGKGFNPEATRTVEGEFAGVTGDGGPGDDLFVDELLDFSNGFSETEELPPEIVENAHEKQATPVAENDSFVAGDDFTSLRGSELSSQGESLESLEWLSHFVEDSFPDYSLAGKFTPPPTDNRPEPQALEDYFATPIQTKARKKKARTGVRVKPVLSPSLAEQDTSATSSASSTTSFSRPNKGKMKPADGGLASPGQRRCIHCGVTKTPQWRTGPRGPKTLCNACGVRYKSGRLLPEYRPACSPTFSSELHSNNHRKVLEMRRKKEVETEGTSLPPPVKSF